MTAPILNNLGMGGGERRVLLKNGSVALDTNGDVIIIPAGKDPEECPCCDSCTTGTAVCTTCDDGDPPDAYTVTFSDFSLCGCLNFIGTDLDITLNTALNGAHTLNYTGACTWKKTLTNGVNEKNWDSTDGSCTGTQTADLDSDYEITLTLDGADNWRLYVARPGPGGQLELVFFDDTQAADLNGADAICQTISATFTNDLTLAGECGDFIADDDYKFGYDGTATVVCV